MVTLTLLWILANEEGANNETDAVQALHILDGMTASMENSTDARSEGFKVFQQGMCYCWSVVVVAAPTEGKRLMEKWLIL